MKNLILLFFSLFSFLGFSQKIINDDIRNFWEAFDYIILEKDSVKQKDIIQKLYIDRGTPGLNGIMRARRYSAEEYIYAINHYPKFWESIRSNTLKSDQFSKEIHAGIERLKNIYPELKPVNIYFEIGVLRTGGTTIDEMLLIGSEIALSDQSIITSELNDQYPHLRNYFDTNPINDIVFLNIHEYIHTQQTSTIGNTLLSQTLIEGVAEFLAEIALDQKSPNPQIAFGYLNEQKIKLEYEKEMFSSNIYNWIMNDMNNSFKMRDLGYFVGYAICKKYYESSTDKMSAIKELIELDYNNEIELMRFVEKTKYFDKRLTYYKMEFDKKVPTVISVTPIKNGSQKVKPGLTKFTVTFSEPLNGRNSGIDYGPLGPNHFPKMSSDRIWSEDKRSITLEADLEPNKRFQLIIDNTFRIENGTRIKPYLLDFKTLDE